MSIHLFRSLTVLTILLCVGFTHAFAAIFEYARSDLPVTHNIGPEDLTGWQFPLVQLQFTQDRFIFPNGGGQTLFYATEAAAISHDPTQIVGLFRIVNNLAGRGEVDFATDPATFSSLPPLPPILDFEFHLFLVPGGVFQGQGPVELIAPIPGVDTFATYVSISRKCNASTDMGQFFCGLTALPDTQFQLTIDLVRVPEPSTGYLLGLGILLLRFKRLRHYIRIGKTMRPGGVACTTRAIPCALG